MDDARDPTPSRPPSPQADVTFRPRVVYTLLSVLVLIAGAPVLWFEVRILLLGFAGVILGIFLYVPALGQRGHWAAEADGWREDPHPNPLPKYWEREQSSNQR